ncbi:hypothetical protein TgHK011_005366 [Trichoderma gracile]|nr:hypothetical protein TgHK011_005366 [Trichoderma gracile]
MGFLLSVLTAGSRPPLRSVTIIQGESSSNATPLHANETAGYHYYEAHVTYKPWMVFAFWGKLLSFFFAFPYQVTVKLFVTTSYGYLPTLLL